ncbi:MAG: response regulator, partial [Pseudomonadota bacterium]
MAVSMEIKKREKVLIVDDSAAVLHILLRVLTQEYAVITARNGERTLALAATQPSPDLIMLDVMMPD